jgi:hypothetical protein
VGIGESKTNDGSMSWRDVMSLHCRLGIIVTLVALALLATFTLVWPTHKVMLAGCPFTLSGRILLGAIVIGLACTGTDALLRSHPKVQSGQVRRPWLRCILPTAVTLAAWAFLARLPNLESRLMGIAVTVAALAVLMAAEYFAADSAARWRGAVVVFLQLATFSVAALLYGAAYPTVLGVNAARAGAVVSALMAIRVLGEDELPLLRILWASLGVGFLLGALSWLLHGQVASAVTYSLVLVVFLYVLVGLARQLLGGKLRPEVLLEYSLVGLAALAVLFFSAQ